MSVGGMGTRKSLSLLEGLNIDDFVSELILFNKLSHNLCSFV